MKVYIWERGMMKKAIYYRLILFCAAAVFLALLCTAPCKVYAKGTAAKTERTVIKIGKNKKTVETLKGSFVKKKGIRYFKNQKGVFSLKGETFTTQTAKESFLLGGKG